MGGIAGIIDLNDNVKESSAYILQAMSGVLNSKGYLEDSYISEHAGLINRSNKNDMTKGIAYASTSAGNLYITHDLRIYNTIDILNELRLKKELLPDCHDPELFLYAFEVWGGRCLNKMNGDFAFAIWNETRKELFLGRDRLGVKPLYYTHIGNTFIFASELKALLKHPLVKREIDTFGVIEELAFLHPSSSKTIIKNIHTLSPGHYLKYNGFDVRVTKYWDLQYRGCAETYDQCIERLQDLLIDAVRIRKVGLESFAVLLSGGLSSSGIACLTNDSNRISTYTLNFKTSIEGNTRHITNIIGDDLEYARAMSSEIHSNHHELLLDLDENEYFKQLSSVTRYRDMPAASGSEVGRLLLFKEIKDQFPIVFSGDCSDYTFGRRIVCQSENSLDSYLKSLALYRLKPFSSILRHPFLYTRYLRQEHKNLIGTPFLWDNPKDKSINTLYYVLVKRELPYILDCIDKISNVSSVEVRLPFCDYRLFEYYFNLPAAYKSIRDSPGYLLRKVLSKYCPRDILSRPKSVFPYPASDEDMDQLRMRVLRLLEFTRRKYSILSKIIWFGVGERISDLSKREKIPRHLLCTFMTNIISLDYLCNEYDLWV